MANNLSDSQLRTRLAELAERLQNEYQHFIGFPAALDYDYAALEPLLELYINNVGDPLVTSWHTLHSKDFEQEVLGFLAGLFRAPADSYQGYVTNGSTECNLYALYVARERHPGAPVYYSTSAHYSIPKNIHLLAMRGVPVPSQPSGEMDYEQLEQLLGKQQGKPAIVVASIGTTMTEAKDNIHRVQQAAQAAGVSELYIHADAALAGIYTALITPHHPFDFADGADSLNISGHKFIGSPVPCGVILVRKSALQHLVPTHNYTGSLDSTISGSRNGHTPLFLWYALHKLGLDGLRQRTHSSQQVAEYAVQALQNVGWESWRNPHALTVMLTSPPELLIVKWQLATADGWSHVICMPGITTAKIDEFVADLTRSRKRTSTSTTKNSGPTANPA